MPAADLPVAWWAFWLVAMGVIAFGGFLWWLLRAALREDRQQRPPEGGSNLNPRGSSHGDEPDPG